MFLGQNSHKKATKTAQQMELPKLLLPLLYSKNKIVVENFGDLEKYKRYRDEVKKLIPDDKELFTFMNARHPFTRVLSFYLDKMLGKRP